MSLPSIGSIFGLGRGNSAVTEASLLLQGLGQGRCLGVWASSAAIDMFAHVAYAMHESSRCRVWPLHIRGIANAVRLGSMQRAQHPAISCPILAPRSESNPLALRRVVKGLPRLASIIT